MVTTTAIPTPTAMPTTILALGFRTAMASPLEGWGCLLVTTILVGRRRSVNKVAAHPVASWLGR
jgi:hypothetical protein